MKLRINPKKIFFILLLVFVTLHVKSQEIPTLKYLDAATLEQLKIDYDNDGDIDYIVAGVFTEKNQGRVYLIENKGNSFKKPEYIYSYPTITVKQQLSLEQKENLITIRTVGTAPNGDETNITGTIYNGFFEGVIVSPVVSTK